MPFVRQLHAETVTPDGFRPYGQLILPTDDGLAPVEEARLVLSAGKPRYYVMRLRSRGRRFHEITRHTRVTQCLGALGGQDWYLAVAPPDRARPRPDLEHLRAFHIPGDVVVKLEVGTWHAGPYFDADQMSFTNLELVDTNEADHDTWDFHQDDLEYVIVHEANGVSGPE